MTRTTRMLLALLVLATVLTCLVGATAAVAFAAVPGEDIANAVSLNDYMGTSLTSVLCSGTGGTGYYWLKVQLSAGNTLKASFTTSLGVVGLKASVQPNSESATFVESVPVSSTECRLNFMAPATGWYNIWVPASSPGTFTVSPVVSTETVKFALSSFKSPRSAKRNHSFSVSAKMWPAYNGPLTPVRFYFDRKITSKRWKSYGYVWGSMSTFPTYSKFAANVKLKARGAYRVRAYFADITRTRCVRTSYHTIKIK